eukprot:scpid62079/ scgid12737/ 
MVYRANRWPLYAGQVVIAGLLLWWYGTRYTLKYSVGYSPDSHRQETASWSPSYARRRRSTMEEECLSALSGVDIHAWWEKFGRWPQGEDDAKHRSRDHKSVLCTGTTSKDLSDDLANPQMATGQDVITHGGIHTVRKHSECEGVQAADQHGVCNPIPPMPESERPKPEEKEKEKGGQQKQTLIPVPTAQSVQRLMLFIGYPRSCSTLVGSLLDAHPHVVLTNEYDLPGQWKKWTAEQRSQREFVFNEIFRVTRAQAQSSLRSKPARDTTSAAKKKKFNIGNYFYKVLNQWQGNFNGPVQIIGDKHGGRNGRIFHCYNQSSRRENIFDEMSAKLKLPIVFIHAMRHPLDIIATYAARRGRLRKVVNNKVVLRAKVGAMNASIIRAAIQDYVHMTEQVAKVKERYRTADLRCESLVANPIATLRKLCSDLHLSCSEEYLTDCARIVRPVTSVTRGLVDWTPDLLKELDSKIGCLDFVRKNYKIN